MVATGEEAVRPPAPTAAQPAPAGQWWPRGWGAGMLVALALVFLGLGLVQADRDSLTLDEGVDLTSGISALVRHDARSLLEHPLLGRVPQAAPALLGHPVVPDSAAWRAGDGFAHSGQVVRGTEAAGRLHRVVLLGRIVPLLEAVACALLIHGLASRTFGARAGLLAAALWLSTPLVLGWGHLGSIDVAFTLATLGVAVGLVRFVEHRDLRRAAWLGVLVGVALATRHTGLVLLAVAVLVVLVAVRRDRRSAVVAAAVVLVVAFASLWAVYRAVAPSPPGGRAGERMAAIRASGEERSAAAKVVDLLPAPVEWRSGFAYLVLTSDAKPSYLFGQAWDGGRWWYVPGAVLLKVPIGVLLTMAAGAVVLARSPRSLRRRALATIVLPAAALVAFTVAQPLDLGVRLVLPSLALGYVLAGAAGSRIDLARLRSSWPLGLDGNQVAAAALACVLVAQGVLTVQAQPHSLAWTASPFQPAYRWASDSNVDIGQDLDRLVAWSRGRRPWVALSVARGLSRPAGSRPLLGADPAEVQGWVAVGVNDLTRLHRRELAWVRRWCPVGTIGGSILLYRFREAPGPRAGPDRPAAPCWGAASSQVR